MTSWPNIPKGLRKGMRNPRKRAVDVEALYQRAARGSTLPTWGACWSEIDDAAWCRQHGAEWIDGAPRCAAL